MVRRRFSLLAKVSTDSPSAVKPILDGLLLRGKIDAGESPGEFVVHGEFEGESAKELNRWLLSSLRKAEKRTRLRSEWVSQDGTKERFFDYVLKKTTKP